MSQRCAWLVSTVQALVAFAEMQLRLLLMAAGVMLDQGYSLVSAALKEQ